MPSDGQLLKVGDVAEFHCEGYPQPQPEWQPQRVTEIRIVDEYDDKEGRLVPEVSWRAVVNYESLVVVVGTENWARNDQVRPYEANRQES